MSYRPTIGLEIHAELKTATKMFCGCRNDADEKRPNQNICPVCTAHPGTLPVINKEAVHKVLLVGTAIGATLADYSEFDRKNYFYPDIPKGYQISQYKYPLVSGGTLASVALTRIHLEEDTARSQHPSTSSGQASISLVDYNRAGVPLMELVTEPVIHDAQTAGVFARELQMLLRALGAGEANLEKGEMRVEANISISKNDTFGTKVEVKNLNSFRSVERAIAYELERQEKLLESGGAVVQETRGWDDTKQVTFSQRKKESSHDYRYFPDPDLPKLYISEVPEWSGENLKAELPELPWERRARYGALGFLQTQDIEQLLNDPALGVFFDTVANELAEGALVKIAANFILNDIAGQRKNKDPEFLPAQGLFLQVVRGYADKSLPSPQAKASLISGTLATVADSGELSSIAQNVVIAHPAVVADYKAGKQAAMQFLVGQGMKESRGSANPEALREALLQIIG